MRLHCLAVAAVLIGSMTALAAERAVPKLVRYSFERPEQFRSLVRAGADVAASGKDWADVVVPAPGTVPAAAASRLAAAVRGLPAKVLMEDAESQFRRLADSPDLGVYHTLDEVKAELDAAQASHPDLVKLSILGKSIEGREIWAARVSSCPQDGQKPAFLYAGATHAREWISTEVVMGLLRRLLQGSGSDPAMRKLLAERVVWLVPVVNPDGVHHSQTEYKMWRKNRRKNADGSFGVDPNRNFGYKWGGEGSSGDPSDETYRGTSPFSEPETQAIRDLSVAQKFVAAISFHSYSELILWPWGYTEEPTRDATVFAAFGEAMAQFSGYKPQQSVQLYPTTGDFDDYMYGELGVLTYTIELGTQFVPAESQVAGIVDNNVKSCVYLLEKAADPFPPLLHEALPATTDLAGPYVVRAQLRSSEAAGAAGVDLVFRTAGSEAEQRSAMNPGPSGMFDAAIPGGALGEIGYHFDLKTGGRTHRVPASGDFTFKVVDSLVLVVADDRGGNRARYYTDALEAAGKACSVWDTRKRGSPTLPVLQAATATVWFTGDTSSETLTATDQKLLADYLSTGGRLLLFGQDIGYEIKNTPFYRDVLQAKYVADNAQNNDVVGVDGSFAAGLKATLGQNGGVAQSYPESFQPLGRAAALLQYGDGQVGALTVATDKGRLAYFGIGLEGIGPLSTRKALLAGGLEWLVASPAVNRVRTLALEKLARAGERLAARALSAALDEARAQMEKAWDRRDAGLEAATPDTSSFPATLKPLSRDAERQSRFRP